MTLKGLNAGTFFTKRGTVALSA